MLRRAIFGVVLITGAWCAESGRTVVVLPLRAGAGLTAAEASIGFGVQNLLENALVIDEKAWDRWALGYYRRLFPKPEDLDAWASGKSAAAPALDSLKSRYVVTGSVVRRGRGLFAQLEVRDLEAHRSQFGAIRIDAPRLIRLRGGFFKLLARMDAAIPPEREAHMMWPERLTIATLVALGRGVRLDVEAMEYGGGKYAVDDTGLREAVRRTPRSYLLRDALGFVQYRNGNRPAARASFEEALRSNDYGLDAYDGLLDVALDSDDVALAERYTARKAAVRGEPAAAEMARWRGRAGDRALEGQHYEAAAAHYREAGRLQPDERVYRTNQAAALIRLRRLSEARSVLDEAVRRFPATEDQTRIFRSMAMLRYEAGEERVDRKEYSQALAEYRAAHDLDRAHNPDRVPGDLVGMGRASFFANEYAHAAEFFLQSADLDRERKEPEAEPVPLLYLAMTYSRMQAWDKVLALGPRALAACDTRKEASCRAHVLDFLGGAQQALNRYGLAADLYRESAGLHREAKEASAELNTLRDLGLCYLRMTRYPEALATYERRMEVASGARDREVEAETYTAIAAAHGEMGHYDKAVASLSQALPIYRELGDRSQQALTLKLRGYYSLERAHWDEALNDMNAAIALYGELGDRGEQGSVWNNVGEVYARQSQKEKAIGYFERALALLREGKDRKGEASALNNLGSAYDDLSRFPSAIRYYEQARQICVELQDRQCESTANNNIAGNYLALGQAEKAKTLFEQSLAIDSELHNTGGQATVLNNLGLIYERMKQFDRATGYFRQALALHREAQNRQGEGLSMNALAIVYYRQQKYDEAAQAARQALAIYREVKDRQAEGVALAVMGGVEMQLNHYQESLAYLQDSLAMLHEVKDRKREASALANLMRLWRAMSRPQLAIFYGKLSVNLYQEIRSEIVTVDKAGGQSFVQSESATYRQLADLLAESGRLAEAQQVLDLLKEEEYFLFVRRDATRAGAGGRIDMTPRESAWQQRYREIQDHIGAIGSERASLLAKPERSRADEERLNALEDDLAVAGKAFQQYLRDLGQELGPSEPARDRMYELRETQGLMGLLRDLGHGAVIIYTLVTESKYRAILITPDAQKGFESAIEQKELNRKILAFREALGNPAADPRPLARELYDILVAPLEPDLRDSGARTLMWSLDGALRYLPVAALWDGQHYLVERYGSTIFTPASRDRLRQEPRPAWTALGLGVSKAYRDFSPLPNVPLELHSIVHEAGKAGGVLNGALAIDDAFTFDAMRTALRRPYEVVHIASHFQFHAGDDASSFLLLGGGEELTLERIGASSGLFNNVELLTLSACNTAMSDTADGGEVDGFGALAQRQGARSVIASLWPVADRSTALLMREFYRLRQARHVTKIEALRQAQLAMLQGKLNSNGAPEPGRGFILGEAKAESFSNPYYWAPFVLIGNWK